MDFSWNKQKAGNVPASFVGYWKIENRKYEIRDNGFYLIHSNAIPYSLMDSGKILIKNGTRFSRLFGSPDELPGVWQLESNPTEELNLREDGTYTYHWPGAEYFGEYSYNHNSLATWEMRAVVRESSGIVTFDPPYAPSVSGAWSLVEPNLSIVLPGGTTVYTRSVRN